MEKPVALIPDESKAGVSFLRMILKELGKEVPIELDITSWELVDLIIKDIHLRNDTRKRVEKYIKELEKENASFRQDIFVYQYTLSEGEY